MSEEPQTCELTCGTSADPQPGQDTADTVRAPDMDMDCDQPIFSALSGDVSTRSGAPVGATSSATTSDTESGIFSGESELCVEHESELDWFCSTEQKLICSHCAIVGSCHGHTVTPLASRVAAVRVSALTGIKHQLTCSCAP